MGADRTQGRGIDADAAVATDATERGGRERRAVQGMWPRGCQSMARMPGEADRLLLLQRAQGGALEVALEVAVQRRCEGGRGCKARRHVWCSREKMPRHVCRQPQARRGLEERCVLGGDGALADGALPRGHPGALGELLGAGGMQRCQVGGVRLCRQWGAEGGQRRRQRVLVPVLGCGCGPEGRSGMGLVTEMSLGLRLCLHLCLCLCLRLCVRLCLRLPVCKSSSGLLLLLLLLLQLLLLPLMLL